MANIVIRPYQLNVAPGGVETVVNLSQYENGRELVFHLVGEGRIDIPADALAIIAGTKPDETIYSAIGTVDADENTVSFQENVQMTAASGKWYAKVKVTASGQTIASGMVKFVIEKDVIPPDAEQSSSDIQGLIAEAAQYAEDARTSFANDARTMNFADLNTTSKTVIGALNELDSETNTLDSSVSDLEALTFPNLPVRTATADSDLIHVNSGGVDYKQTKESFVTDLSRMVFFETSSTLTSQVDALPNSWGDYYGVLLAYGHQTETGMPENSVFYVHVNVIDGNYRWIEARVTGNTYNEYMNVKSAGVWSGWILKPKRSEITSINSSLANKSSIKYFNGTEDVTLTIPTTGYYQLPRPTAVQGKNVFSIAVVSWASNTGAFWIVPYGTSTYDYVVGASGTQVRTLRVRYWWLED